MAYIRKISFVNDKIFNKLDVTLINKVPNNNENYLSMIIGENGTGKSQFLRAMVDSVIDSCLFENSKLETIVNDGEKFSNIPKIICSATNINDKYRLDLGKKIFPKDNYRYLGMRSATNNAFVGKYKKIYFNAFVKIISEFNRLDAFVDALKVLDFPVEFSFEFSIGRTASKVITPDKLQKKYSLFLQGYNKSTLKLKEMGRMDERRITEFLTNESTLESTYNTTKSLFNSKGKFILHVDLLNEESCNNFMQKASLVNDLLLNKIITVREFYVDMVGNIGFSMLSSGQYQLLNTLITLSSEITNDSLIFIDEPEVSLHPKWQMIFISIIERLLKRYKNVHVIIATHSHLLVSSLPVDNSCVIISKKNNCGEIVFETLEANTSGWSSDFILYNVFGLATARNNALEDDLRLIATVISEWGIKKQDLGMYKVALGRLKKFNLPENDPLVGFIKNADVFLSENS
ncbi:AAA family ATPase [Budvicia aquatica]|uniref:AAA family ATPase n=1 Tax=Budvicia aquatica TaxID=82979 RepID=UPI0020851913|nr:AAA family ATPase [Budvicia aquatica]GKX50592.1 hypothetical protein SOASR029_09010 [Budvicia aquatica]